MPIALALLSVEQGGKPLLVAPTSGIVLGSATAVLQEFVAHVGLDAVGRDAGELRLDSSWVVVHYKLLAGSAVLAAVLCERRADVKHARSGIKTPVQILAELVSTTPKAFRFFALNLTLPFQPLST